MHFSSKTISEIDYILSHFDENFKRYKGCKIALYPGEYLDEILLKFDAEYRFYCVLEQGSTQAPADVELIILTDHREEDEPDYNLICGFCEANSIPLLDLFGLDQIQAHRELAEQHYITIPEWKELLAPYDVITFPAPGAVVKYNRIQKCWAVRRRFLILYRWMLHQGKTVLFFREKEELIEAFDAEHIDIRDHMLDRTGKDRGYLRLAEQYKGKRIFHIGTNIVIDGIVPREYGIDTRMIRGFRFSNNLSTAGTNEWVFADKTKLLEEIDRHDVISFDVFDTLIKRTVLYPNDVFEVVEERTGVRGFAEDRYKAQRRRTHLSHDEIYDRMREHYGYDGQTAAMLQEEELKVEHEVIMPRRSMLEIFEYAKNQGKTVFLTSDMYLDISTMQYILEKNGIVGYDGFFLSDQHKKYKHEGLYEELLKQMNSGEIILHIGDNHFSDVQSAGKFGLDVFYIPSCLDLARKNGYEDEVQMCQSLAERKLMGLSIALGFDDPFEQHADSLIANMVVAPLIMAYLQWVCRKMAGKGYDYFLLSSRDGWILKEAYNRLQSRSGSNLPPGKYFYINRHAALLTVMDDFELAKHIVRLRDYDSNPPALLHDLFCLPTDQLLPYGGETAEEYFRMHEKQIEAAANTFRDNYRKYLNREGLEETNCAVMDFVAEGTSQMMLEKHMPLRLDGYYIGVPEYIFRYAQNISFYLDQDLVDYNTEMKTEVYFTSMEPALIYIDENGEPAFAEECRGPEVLKRISAVHDKVHHYLNQYIDYLYDPADSVDSALAFALIKANNRYGVENHYFDDLSGKPITAGVSAPEGVKG